LYMGRLFNREYLATKGLDAAARNAG